MDLVDNITPCVSTNSNTKDDVNVGTVIFFKSITSASNSKDKLFLVLVSLLLRLTILYNSVL